MFGLPENSVVGKQLPKTAIYAKFAMNTAERERFDADISRIAIANVVDTRHLAEGKDVKSIYVFAVQLKRKDYDPKNIATLAKLIEQKIVFALMFEGETQLATYCTRLITSEWQPTDDVTVPLAGLNLDSVWENIVAAIGSITIVGSNTIAEQIAEDDAHAKLMKQIEQLEHKVRTEKQPRKKLGCLWKTIIGIGVYFLFCGIFGLLMGDMMSTSNTVLEENTIYRLDLSGVLVDQVTEENPFDALLGEMSGQTTTTVGLNNVLSNIALAKDNDKVLGIYLRGGDLSAGPASAKALRDALLDFKQSGKFIIAYADS